MQFQRVPESGKIRIETQKSSLILYIRAARFMRLSAALSLASSLHCPVLVNLHPHLPSSDAGPVSVRKTQSCDLEDHIKQLQNWELEYDQLDSGEFRGSFLDVRLPGLQLFTERTSRRLRQCGELSSGSVIVATMLRGQGDWVVNGVRPRPEGLLACCDGKLEITSPPDCTMAGLMVDEPLLQQVANDLLGRPLLLPRGSVIVLAAAPDVVEPLISAMRLSLSIAAIEGDAAQGSAVQAETREAMLVKLVDILNNGRNADTEGRALQRKRMVDRACELMMSRPDAPPCLAEVCKAVGASPSKLSYCFHDVLGMSPNRYVRMLRLNAARRDLRRSQDAQVTVYDVATRWGFWHFGRFSLDYKRQFCELPSESLRRSRTPPEPPLSVEAAKRPCISRSAWDGI